MIDAMFYSVIKTIGSFSNELSYKNKWIEILSKHTKEYKAVLAIENAMEPGMPDLLLVDHKDRSVFVETKYAERGVISFKRTQLPWYKRNARLNIWILAYNDVTKNNHLIAASVILLDSQSRKYRLQDETDFKIKENL